MKNLKTKVLLSFMLVFVLVFQSLPVSVQARPIKVITKNVLPVTCTCPNGMSLKINSFSVDEYECVFNVTITNNSDTDYAKIMTTTYNISDGKNALKFVSQDQVLWDSTFLSRGDSVTGNIVFEGIRNKTKTFTLNGGLYSTYGVKIKLKFKNDKVIDGDIPRTCKSIITKSDLPYSYRGLNNMEFTINSYDITNGKLTMNVTIKNCSSVLNKGGMGVFTMYNYDNSYNSSFLGTDSSLWNATYNIQHGESYTGNMYSNENVTSSLIYIKGNMNQGIDFNSFSFSLKNE